MTPISEIASFGLWPALPVTGYALLVRHLRASSAISLPPVTTFALASAAGIAVWSPVLLLSAVLGLYQGWYFGLLGWAMVLFGLAWGLRHRGGLPRVTLRLSVWDWVLTAGLVVAAVLYLGFPTESIVADHDEGMYVGQVIFLAHHGTLHMPYPWLESAKPILAPAFWRFPGIWPDGPTLTPYFGHLFHLWLAQAFSTFDYHGMYRFNGFIALLSLALFYGLCRQVMPKAYAVVASLFLGLNPSQIWLARITLSEILTQLFIWSGLLLLFLAFDNEHKASARWAGLLLGLSLAVRIDSLVLVPLLLMTHLATRIVESPENKTGPVWTAFYQTAVPTFVLSFAYYPVFSAPYFRRHYLLFRPVLGVIVVSAVALLLLGAPWIARRLRPVLTARPVLIGFGVVLFAASAYAYWVRPHVTPYAFLDGAGLLSRGHISRSYVEDSLVNLGKYLSPPVVWMAIFGWFVALWTLVRRGTGLGLLATVVLTGGSSAAYIWNQTITPMHFWAIRRFVPLSIPAFVLFGALGMWWLSARLTTKWRVPLVAATIAFLLLFTVRVDAFNYSFAEAKGYYVQVRGMALALPEDTTIPAVGVAKWWVPLYTAFDRHVVPITMPTTQGRKALRRWIVDQRRHNKPAYILSDGTIDLPNLQRAEVKTFVLTRSQSVWTPHPLPNKILSERKEIYLYKISPSK